MRSQPVESKGIDALPTFVRDFLCRLHNACACLRMYVCMYVRLCCAGNWTSSLVRYVVCWPENNVRPFIDARCYKVVANDTNDDIVHDSASLRTGVAEWTVRGLNVRKRKKKKKQQQKTGSSPGATVPVVSNDPSVSKGATDSVVVDMTVADPRPAGHLGGGNDDDGEDDDDGGGGGEGDAHRPLMSSASTVPATSTSGGGSVTLSETAAENILAGGSLALEKFRDVAERMLELAGTCDAVTSSSQASSPEEGPGASALKGWYAAIERLTARAILVFSSQKVVAAMQARRGQVRACACVCVRAFFVGGVSWRARRFRAEDHAIVLTSFGIWGLVFGCFRADGCVGCIHRP